MFLTVKLFPVGRLDAMMKGADTDNSAQVIDAPINCGCDRFATSSQLVAISIIKS